jgi:hypothetical protein
VQTWAVIGGIFLIAITLWDAFETIILSRRVSRKIRLVAAEFLSRTIRPCPIF